MEAESVATLIEAVRRAEDELGGENLWCRGHARSEWELKPGAFRKHPTLEAEVAKRFRLQAPARRPNCPAHDDLGAWLPLMQHYGVSTRLLDWSESALVAAYFAILHDREDVDASIWLLSPGRMNERLNGLRKIPSLTYPAIEPVVAGAFDQEARTTGAWAVTATVTDQRMVAQLSNYTLHGDGTPLNQQPDHGHFLRVVTIPEAAVDRVRGDMNILGVRRSILFPDLQNVAQELNDLIVIE
jgi:hypothetical protein